MFVAYNRGDYDPLLVFVGLQEDAAPEPEVL
jgi:hypothetical protein